MPPSNAVYYVGYKYKMVMKGWLPKYGWAFNCLVWKRTPLSNAVLLLGLQDGYERLVTEVRLGIQLSGVEKDTAK